MKIPFLKDAYLLTHWILLILWVLLLGLPIYAYAMSIHGGIVLVLGIFICLPTVEWKWVTPTGIYWRWGLCGIRWNEADVLCVKNKEGKDPTLVSFAISSGTKHLAIENMSDLGRSVREDVLRVIKEYSKSFAMQEKEASLAERVVGVPGAHVKRWVALIIAIVLFQVVHHLISQHESSVEGAATFLFPERGRSERERLMKCWEDPAQAKKVGELLQEEGKKLLVAKKEKEALRCFNYSFEWLRHSADLGNSCAMVKLLLMEKTVYRKPKLSPEDQTKYAAIAFNKLSAEGKHTVEETVCWMLCYQYGIGTKQSDVKAQQIQNLLKQIQSDVQEAIKSKKTTVTVSGRVDGERDGEDHNRHQ